MSIPFIIGLGGSLNPNSTSEAALSAALDGARDHGARVELLSLRQLRLPFYDPSIPLTDYPPIVSHLIRRVEEADAVLVSTPGYLGQPAGETGNALRFLRAQPPTGYRSDPLHDIPVGLVATASTETMAQCTLRSLHTIVQAMGARVLPLEVAISHPAGGWESSWKLLDGEVLHRLRQLGTLAAEQGRVRMRQDGQEPPIDYGMMNRGEQEAR